MMLVSINLSCFTVLFVLLYLSGTSLSFHARLGSPRAQLRNGLDLRLLAKATTPAQSEYYTEVLGIGDLASIYSMAVDQFSSKDNSDEDLSLKLQILNLFTPKLLFPPLMGHTIIGVKDVMSRKLIGFVDLSLQRSCGSMMALKVSALPCRKLKHNNLKPYLCNLLVSPEYRRRGFARVLINECVERARKWNESEINLHVETTTPAPLALYLSEGFNVVNLISASSVYFMRKNLNK